jgi:N-acetylmuramoyl-L-alanine amidase
MNRLFMIVCCLSAFSAAAVAQEWRLDKFPSPIWAQPGEVLKVTLTGPPGLTGFLELSDGTEASAPLLSLGEGRYIARLRLPDSGTERLFVRPAPGDVVTELGTVEVSPLTRTFTAHETAVTRQGPDSDYERLTPLVPGATVVVNGRRGDWYRSAASEVWLDGRSGTVADGPAAGHPVLKRIMVDPLPNGDAKLTLSCGIIPEAQATLPGNGPLTLTLPDTEDLIFDLTKDSTAANFLGPITVRALAPRGTVVDIALAQRGIGGYHLEAGDQPGDLVLVVRRPVPRTLKELIITLDAGHGGPKDPGTVGHGGLPEKVLNLRVTEALARMLKERGATVLMTRTSDADVAPDEQGASHELQARIDLSVAAGAHLFLSLHHNARPDVEEGKISHGTDIYWYQPVSEPLARALADPIADAIEEPLRTSRFRSFHVIRQTFSPSVLIEFQYLSNPRLESEVLDRPDYPDKAAAGVVKGLEAYLRSLP